MGIFDSLGNALKEVFSVSGERLTAAYDLGGDVIYTAEALEREFDGAHRVWRFKKAENKNWQTVQIPHDWSIYNDFSSTSPATCEGGTVLGTDNGNAASVENMRGNVRSAFSGKCLCVCRHDGKAGELTVSAKAEGLEEAQITVRKI